MDRNNTFSALKGLAMCMIMAGHLHIAIGGGFCAYFFVIMSGVLCRLSYREGGRDHKNLCKIHMA